MKRLFHRISAFFLGIFTILTTCFGGSIPVLYQTKITLSPQMRQTLQQIDGFGTSACWWSPNLSDPAARADLIRRLYGKDGLGLNIYRYNVGGGVNPSHERVQSLWRRTESFLVIDEKTGEGHYDFTRDANAQAALFAALKQGTVDTVVLFANSPHYSMTISGESSGALLPGASNLRPDCYQAFVDYFLTIAEYFLSKGVPVKILSPINEPQWDWGGSVKQEGCHYETEEIVRLLHLFAVEIENRGLPVKLAAPESGEIGEKTREYFRAIAADPVILRSLGSFAYHSYWADGDLDKKRGFGEWYRAQAFSALPLEMTEWCELPNKHPTDDPAAAVFMARVMAEDLAETRAQSWTSWVAVNNEGVNRWNRRDYCDAMFTAREDFSSYSDTYRYYAMGHYARFVPKGSFCIGCGLSAAEGADVSVCAFLRPDGDLVLVLPNAGRECAVRLNAQGKTMEIYTTDAAHKLAQTYSGAFLSAFTLSRNSVTTVVVHGVTS